MSRLLPGIQVEARGLPWELVHIEPAGEQYRLRLRCIQGDLQGAEIDLLHPFEHVEPISTELDPRRAGRLQQWRIFHDAFLLEQALGPSALLAVQPGRLDIAPYQLVPVMRALRMSRPRLLLADGVGLGKTIEAGLVMAELIARRRAHRILIVSPAGPLLEQWHREMRERFGLRFSAIRGAGDLQQVRHGHELGANPFDHLSYCLTSVDFAKQEKVLQELERSVWDLVVLDEAHHCVRLGSAGDWEDSRRRRLAEVLAQQSDGLLLLTATPHDGFDAHFASIVELLDASLVDGRGELRGERYRQHVVRRLKQHIKDPTTGEPLFRTRSVTPRAVVFGVDTHPEFSLFQQALLAAVAPRLKAAIRGQRFGEVLAFVSLLKRSVSTVAACRNTLTVIRDRYRELSKSGEREIETRRQRLRTLRDYQRRMERFGALSFDEEQDCANLEAEDMASDLVEAGLDQIVGRIDVLQRSQRREKDRGKRVSTTGDALDALVDLAENALDQDPKLLGVLAELRAIRSEAPRANVLVYTEYTDSQDALVVYLQRALSAGELTGRILAVSGRAEHAAERGHLTERFAAEDDLVLVSTDATAEGLNLHDRCHHLLHLELPYNPNRLAQRTGRIDRYGQRHDPDVRYLYLAGTFEERLLLRLVAKYERQRARLTFVPDTLGGITTDDAQTVRLLEGLAEEEGALFEQPPREIRQMEVDGEEDAATPAYQELLAEVERALTGYERAAKTSSWMFEAGLNAEAERVAEAARARDEGKRLGAVELVDFVTKALESDSAGGGTVLRTGACDLELRLPSVWSHGLDDIPGYDARSRVLRLTTDRQRSRDDHGQPLGYLGRAHPMVRRALDRVRNLRFGGTDAYVDRRVSAVELPIARPALLLTFLGAVESDRGHELERVLGVLVDENCRREVFTDPHQWLERIAGGRATSTRDLWERCFASWGDAAQRSGAEAVRDAFATLAETLIAEHRGDVEAERVDLDGWVQARAQTICGSVVRVQFDLFAGSAERPAWQTLEEPTSRLTAFATDRTNPPSARGEAEGVLRLYQKRVRDLTSRAKTRCLDPQPLGLLMLIPGGDDGRVT